jgi:4-amino-4-deoxy-L-arabinose transferase-like glycosyltransferase
VFFGLLKGLFVAAAADAYGYVSQADLWANGTLIVRQPFAAEMTWPNAAESLAPLGYRPHTPAPHGTDIVPIYSPGVPMLMAVFRTVGGADAVYLVVPLLGGVAVWATYIMGKRFGGRLVGASAAMLLATSPPFLFEITAPASDVASTAWWAVAFTALLFESPRAAVGAGLATGMAILTRPNLAPLALVPAGLLLLQALRRDRAGAVRLAWFCVAAVPACLAVGLINWRLYGSPLASGYGSLSALYDVTHFWPNLSRYPRWLIDTQTPAIALAAVAPFVLPAKRIAGVSQPRLVATAWLCAVAIVFLLYAFYLPFDEWWYLRFLMPVYPLVFVLMASALGILSTAITRSFPRSSGLVVVFVIAVLAWHSAMYAFDRGAAEIWRAEQRYRVAGEYIAANLPARAAFLSVQHSGSIRHYSGRLTIRFDLIAPRDLDLVVRELGRLGYDPYIVLDEAEEEQFRARFERFSPLGKLDPPPVAVLDSNRVRIYRAGRRVRRRRGSRA